MTQMAREVLQDCRDSLAEFQYGAQGSRWRRWWILNTTLLRAVGHILDSVDGNKSSALRQAIKERWPILKQDALFKDFIEDTRNNVLKEYTLKATQVVSVQITGITMRMNAPAHADPEPAKAAEATYTYIIGEGPFKGEQQVTMIERAIHFWERHLDAIDRRAAELDGHG